MFEELDQVDWAHLWACGPGRGAEVPRLLRTLASSTDRGERTAALSKLAERVIYQGGSILEVTPYAVPFLLELLSVETLEEHADLFALLIVIARAEPFAIGAGALDDYPDEAAAPPELQARLAEERGWMRQAYEAVELGVPTYLTFLTHPAGETRMRAAYLLSLFPRQAPVTVPALRARLAQEDDELVQAALVSSLGDLLDSETALRQFVHPYLRAETPPLLRCLAALAYARRAGSATPLEVVQILLEVIASRETVEASFQQLPQFHVAHYDSLAAHICETLAKIGPEQAIPALTAVLRGYSSAGRSMEEVPLIEEVQFWNECEVAARSLLAAVFTEGELLSGTRPPKPLALPLDQAQRTALTVLVEDDVLWRPYAQLGDSQLYDLRQLFWDYDLPDSREALGTLLQGHEARPPQT